MKSQRLDMFLNNAKKMSRGFLVEPAVRIQGRKAYPSSICCLCIRPLSEKPNLKVYACSHTFHQSCLRDTNNCPMCYRTDFLAVRNEYEQASELAYQGKKMNDESEEEDLEERYRRKNDEWNAQERVDE